MRFSIEDAKTEIEQLKHRAKPKAEAYRGHIARGRVAAIDSALAILAKVEPEPDEEGRAVQWLMKQGKPMAYGVNSQCWISNGLIVNPVTEADKSDPEWRDKI